ncbi:hypothetical protein GEV33_012695 [Tenebrio molitor]|uniref:Uncharacterized protein n=1 Tax=Tenebrio molitor TaxID=7067 RepID=A0A8J6L729_TENMO|nr:hypothetical protein GEV33_012695 [Tenebrio molitor]
MVCVKVIKFLFMNSDYEPTTNITITVRPLQFALELDEIQLNENGQRSSAKELRTKLKFYEGSNVKIKLLTFLCRIWHYLSRHGHGRGNGLALQFWCKLFINLAIDCCCTEGFGGDHVSGIAKDNRVPKSSLLQVGGGRFHAVNIEQDICLVLIVPNSDYLLNKFTERSWRWLKSPDSSPHHLPYTYIFYRVKVLTPCWPLHRSNTGYSDTVRSTIIMLKDEIIPDKWGKLFQDICYMNYAIHYPSGKNLQIGTSRRTYTTPNHNRANSMSDIDEAFPDSEHSQISVLCWCCGPMSSLSRTPNMVSSLLLTLHDPRNL